MTDKKPVWIDGVGDLRKKDKSNTTKSNSSLVNESVINLKVRRLTSGKGRTVIEITGLPKNKAWCQKLAKELKKSLGCGGTYKNDFIEIHGEKMDQVTSFLDKKSIKWKKTGG